MKSRRLHRIIGIIMILPFFAWAVTGFIFFVKPGYGGAYEILQPKAYPLDKDVSINPDPQWLEFRFLRTTLGDHLLVKTAEGWQHLDSATLAPRSAPSDQEIRALVQDAISVNPNRYGQIVDISASRITTDTGIRITLDWNRLSLSQRGPDTDQIDMLYRIHYLQWTGLAVIDRVIGITGIVLILILSAVGLKLFLSKT